MIRDRRGGEAGAHNGSPLACPIGKQAPRFSRIDGLTGPWKILSQVFPVFSPRWDTAAHGFWETPRYNPCWTRRRPRHASIHRSDAMIGTWRAEVGLGVSQRVLAHFRRLVSCRARVIFCAPDGALRPGCVVRRSTLRCSGWRRSKSGHPAKHSQHSATSVDAKSQRQLKHRACAGQ